MSIAQVIYNISNDSEFAMRWKKDPEAALAGKGLKLSREELAFLSGGLTRGRFGDASKVRFSEVVTVGHQWV